MLEPDRFASRSLVLLVLLLGLGGCEAYQKWQCSQAVAGVQNAFYVGLGSGVLGWLLAAKDFNKLALALAAGAIWLTGYGSSTTDNCGAITVFGWVWAAASTILFGAPVLGKILLPRFEAAAKERERQAALATEKVRLVADQRRQEQEAVERQAAEQTRAEEAARVAEKERAEFEEKKARLREERERSGAEKALHGHVEVITSAVRAIRRDGDNAVLINTIDSELKAIARNERITAAMLTHADLKDDIALIAQMLAERGVDDKILLNRLRKVFQLDAAV